MSRNHSKTPDEPAPPFRPHAKNVRDVFTQALQELAKPYPSVKLPQWDMFNTLTGGLRTREFSILCGPTGKGKTTWMANLSAQLTMAKVKHYVASVETGETDFVKRVMSVWVGSDVNTGDALGSEALHRVTMASMPHVDAGMLELALYDNRVPVEKLCKELRYHSEVLGCRVAILDNLNFFLEATRAADTLVEMDRVVHELVILAKQIDMHLILVMHPKKTEHGRVLSEFDIKGSSLAVQEAHNIFLFNHPSDEDLKKGVRLENERELKIAKLRRRGQFVGRTIYYRSVQTRYVEHSYS